MADGHCKYGCYPVDKFFFKDGKGFKIEEVLKLTAKLSSDHKKSFEERMKEHKIQVIDDIHSFRLVLNLLTPIEGSELGEKILDKMGSDLKYKEDLGEPYVKKGDRTLLVTGRGGKALNVLNQYNTLLRGRYGYSINKVKEWLNVAPLSPLYSEITQRKREAETTLAQVMANINELYQQKHLIDHDLRKMESRKQSFEKAKKKKGEYVDREEALKADFVDLVDVNTQQHSILQMQVNNIFPTITADFYRMTCEEDLLPKGENGGTGVMADLPENEKAILRKKWKLYTIWKEEFGKEVKEKVDDLKKRKNSILMSIKQTEEWLRPYIRTLLHVKQDEEGSLDQVTEASMMEGFSTSWRGLKLIADKAVRDKDGKPTHYDVLITYVEHASFAGAASPGQPGSGTDMIKLTFKEYLIDSHVYDLVFKAQVEEKKEEIKRFLNLYLGETTLQEDMEYELKKEKKNPKEMDEEELEKWKEEEKKLKKERNRGSMSAIYWGDKGDSHYVPLKEIADLRGKIIGPKHHADLYLDTKFGAGLFTMA